MNESMSVEALRELADAHRWEELDRALDDRAVQARARDGQAPGRDEGDDDARVLRARQSLSRGGPLDEAVLGARAALRRDDGALASEVAELLERRGASRAALLLREQLPLTEQHARPATTPAPIDAALRARRFDEVAAHHREACERHPRGDEAPRRRFDALLAAWAAGEAGAVDALRSLRDATAEATLHAHRDVHRAASEVIRTLERDPEIAARGPQWRLAGLDEETPPTGEITSWLHALVGVAPPSATPPPIIAHIRIALERAGVRTLRVHADDETIAHALSVGAWVVLEEERPTDTGFPLVVGVEQAAGLTLLADADGSARLVHREALRARTRLFDDAGLVVVGTGEAARERLAQLEALGVREHAPAIAVDRCLVDEAGDVPPRARVAALADEAIERAPDVAMLWRVRGEALLEDAKVGRLRLPDGPFEPWYAEVRRRFPDAEWPLQIYAQTLELLERWEEAAIAWSDAANRDWLDERNTLGAARARLGLGDLGGAERALRATLQLAPTNVEALARGAMLASWRGDDEVARVRAELATELGPHDPLAQSALVTVLERAGELDEATAVLRQAHADPSDPGGAGVAVRLARRLLHEGAWAEAQVLADAGCAASPGDPEAWAVATTAAWAVSDVDGAMGRAISGLRSTRASEPLIAQLTDVVAMLLVDDAAISVSRDLTSMVLGGGLDAVGSLTGRLLHRGRVEPARAVYEAAEAAVGPHPQLRWQLAQFLLAAAPLRPALHAEGVEALEQTVAMVEGFGPARVLLGWARLDADPEQALALATHPSVAPTPTLAWPLRWAALDALGARDDADAILTRIRGLERGALESPLSLLRQARLLGRARALLEALSPDDDAISLGVWLALARHEVGESVAAWEGVAALQRRKGDDDVPRATRLLLAEAAGDWEALARLATEGFEDGRRTSGSGFADVWHLAAQHAAARDALGDAKPRRALLERAPRHPTVRWALARVGARCGAASASEDERALREIAPGAHAAMQAGVTP